jgi:hypothetical protein
METTLTKACDEGRHGSADSEHLGFIWKHSAAIGVVIALIDKGADLKMKDILYFVWRHSAYYGMQSRSQRCWHGSD